MPDVSYTDDDLRRLSWQCRRGIKEVEVLLVPFFERYFQGLEPADQATFVQLLEQQDVELFEWFTQRSKSENADYQAMVELILARLAA